MYGMSMGLTNFTLILLFKNSDLHNLITCSMNDRNKLILKIGHQILLGCNICWILTITHFFCLEQGKWVIEGLLSIIIKKFVDVDRIFIKLQYF